MRVLVCIAVTVLLSACGSMSEKDVAKVLASTDEYVMQLDSEQTALSYIYLDTFVLNVDTASLAIAYNGDKAVQITYLSRSALGNEWKFTLSPKNGQTIYLWETGLDLAAGHYFQNRFYYHKGKLIKGQTAIAQCSHAGHNHDSEWHDYVSKNKDNDFRLNAAAVDVLIKEILETAKK